MTWFGVPFSLRIALRVFNIGTLIDLRFSKVGFRFRIWGLDFPLPSAPSFYGKGFGFGV